MYSMYCFYKNRHFSRIQISEKAIRYHTKEEESIPHKVLHVLYLQGVKYLNTNESL